MRGLFYRFFQNITACFSGYSLIFHLLAIGLTFAIAVSGFDWTYFQHTRNPALQRFLFPAAVIGGLAPILVPLALLIAGKAKKDSRMTTAAFAIGQAAILALLISWLYKALTGRAHPEPWSGASVEDMTRLFRFGFWRGGIFWGWPSSHTAVAFSTAVALTGIFPRNTLIRVLALAYALYIGIGVSASIHWFSDFVAGAILGAMAGRVAGKSFLHATPLFGFKTKRDILEE